MTKQRMMSFIWMGFFAFAGGMASQYFFSGVVSPSIADATQPSSFQFHDQNGKTRLDIGMNNEQPGETLFGEDGKPRIQFGTYDGSVSIDEKGLPVMTFYDNEGRLKMLLRIAPGKNQSPVLVMKDNKQRDRIVMGLGLNDADEDPFLAYFDKDGGKHLAFGVY